MAIYFLIVHENQKFILPLIKNSNVYNNKLIKQQQKIITDKNDLLSLQMIVDKLKNDDNDILLVCKLK